MAPRRFGDDRNIREADWRNVPGDAAGAAQRRGNAMSMLSFRMEAAGGPIRARAAALWRGVRRIIGWPWRVAAARRDMADLARLSDHELADIGLSGQDLRDARGLRLDENPSLLLTRRARERARRMY